jgi:hypothetical protein
MYLYSRRSKCLGNSSQTETGFEMFWVVCRNSIHQGGWLNRCCHPSKMRTHSVAPKPVNLPVHVDSSETGETLTTHLLCWKGGVSNDYTIWRLNSFFFFFFSPPVNHDTYRHAQHYHRRLLLGFLGFYTDPAGW